MATLQIKPIHHATFDAEAVMDGNEIAVRFAGTADLSVKEIMDRFLIDVHAEASRMDARSVSVDVSGLEFINSSCLMAIVTWITTVQSMVNRRYQIAFHFKAVRDWHRRSFDVLTQLGEDVVTVRPSPPAPQTPPAPAPAGGAKPEGSADEATRVSRPPKHE
ncbi:MAG: hypothetical protein QOI66_3894 [Myxococcales bacterium]|jgi:hypothetical protein|nr:hypothetical protein [Myxococcales bacterium]